MAVKRPLFFMILSSWSLFTLKVLSTTATKSTVFNFTSFAPNGNPNITFSGDAFASGEKIIQLTRNQLDKDILQSAGRITYASPVQIWDPVTRHIADFTTHFRFEIDGLDKDRFGDGLAFFMAPVGSDQLPLNSTGQWLGLFNSTTNGTAATQLVAVEFDTFQNAWDPSANHIGIDINSIVSVSTRNWKTEMRNGSTGSAWVGYNSTTGSFYAFLTYEEAREWSAGDKPSISYVVNLTEVVPDKVVVGFSASTGASTELHKILSWNFESTLIISSTTNLTSDINAPRSGNKSGRSWIVWLGIAVGILLAGFGFGWMFLLWRRGRLIMLKFRSSDDNIDHDAFDASIEDKFVKGTVLGPRRFTYKELALATENFSEEGKLGQGGFGGVYKGSLVMTRNGGLFETIAVKKISRGSTQGRKEYVTEVTVISRLRHRNLVKLIGWCHEYDQFLLVYEYMPNGSLDSYLFGKKKKKKPSLEWKTRYKIALGVASAILYLHEEWEQCVVHRDIKSSNVMLDSSFNAKLGDFGLARFVDHGLGSQTTVLAGTMGYLAPECLTTGRASKESDMYSFGVVALEIACGRRPVDLTAEEERKVRLVERKVRLVEWVWEMYGEGRVTEAADESIDIINDELDEVERLMRVGLWCVHPDDKSRPSIKQVVQVLNGEAEVPRLPARMPVAVYCAPPLSMTHLDFTSSTLSVAEETTAGRSRSAGANTSSTGSSRASSTRSLLEMHRRTESREPDLLLCSGVCKVQKQDIISM